MKEKTFIKKVFEQFTDINEYMLNFLTGILVCFVTCIVFAMFFLLYVSSLPIILYIQGGLIFGGIYFIGSVMSVIFKNWGWMYDKKKKN